MPRPRLGDYDDGMNGPSMSDRRRSPCSTCGSLLLVVLSASQLLAQAPARQIQPHLVLLDGQSIAFQSLEIAGGKLSGQGVPDDLTIDDLRRIELPLPPGATVSAEKP